MDLPSATEPLPTRSGTLFLGYVEANLGLGESLRGLISAALTQEMSVAIYPFSIGVETRLGGPFFPEHYDESHRYDVNVIEVAIDRLPQVFQGVDRRIFVHSYNILRTYWELSTTPSGWRELLADIDEIWAPNNFVKKSLSSVFHRTITVVPPSPSIDYSIEFNERSNFSLQEDKYLFIFAFDYNSSASRKNPLGVIKAFRQAFPEGSEKVGLVVKSTGHHPKLKQQLADISKDDSRIVVIDKTLSRRDLLGLVNSCDCYVSLHRSEGFGLGMVEAMSFGKPVIATGYSGSEDFLSRQTGFPVNYVLRPIEPGEYVYSEGAEWAEPSIEHASGLMRFVYENPEDARAMGQRGRLYVSQRYSAEVVGAKVKARLTQIRESLLQG